MYSWSGFYASRVASDTAAHLLMTWASAGLVVLLWDLACRGGWQDVRSRLPALIGLTACCSLLISVHVYRQDLALLSLAVACGIVQAQRAGDTMRPWYTIAALVSLRSIRGSTGANTASSLDAGSAARHSGRAWQGFPAEMSPATSMPVEIRD